MSDPKNRFSGSHDVHHGRLRKLFVGGEKEELEGTSYLLVPFFPTVTYEGLLGEGISDSRRQTCWAPCVYPLLLAPSAQVLT